MTFQFFPERVQVVDQVGSCTLVRGPMPLTGGDTAVFAYQEIGKATGIDLDSRHFVDISLIDCTGEQAWLAGEMGAFGIVTPGPSYWPPYERADYDPAVGTIATLTTEGVSRPADFFWWPIEGISVDCPDSQTFLGLPGYNFSGLVERFLELAHSPEPTVVYFHCMLGADRTGALHGAYLLNRGVPFDEMMTKISQTPAGKPAPDYCRLLESYAKTLSPTRKYEIVRE